MHEERFIIGNQATQPIGLCKPSVLVPSLGEWGGVKRGRTSGCCQTMKVRKMCQDQVLFPTADAQGNSCDHADSDIATTSGAKMLGSARRREKK